MMYKHKYHNTKGKHKKGNKNVQKILNNNILFSYVVMFKEKKSSVWCSKYCMCFCGI